MNNIKLFAVMMVVDTALSLGTLLMFGEPQAIPASSTADSIIRDGDGQNVSVDPFGYFMGEWNLWEFIGDSLASLIG